MKKADLHYYVTQLLPQLPSRAEKFKQQHDQRVCRCLPPAF